MPSATPISRSVEFVPLAFAWSSERMVASTAVDDRREHEAHADAGER